MVVLTCANIACTFFAPSKIVVIGSKEKWFTVWVALSRVWSATSWSPVERRSILNRPATRLKAAKTKMNDE